MSDNRKNKPTVICVGGSATIDLIFLVDEVKLPSAKIQATQFVETGGGMAANAAVAVQRLGGQAIYWGRVGDDEPGDQVRTLLAHEGVDVESVHKLPGFRTKLASILIDRRGERLVVSSQPQGYPPDPSWLPIEKVAAADADHGRRVLAGVVHLVARWPGQSRASSRTRSAIASAEVSPGDSMPNRLTRRATPCTSGPWITKSAGGSPGPESLGRIPAYAGCSAASGSCGQYSRISA